MYLKMFIRIDTGSTARISAIAYVVKLVNNNRILINLQIMDQLIIMVVTISIPVILVTWLLMFVNNLLCKEQMKFQNYENMVNSSGKVV